MAWRYSQSTGILTGPAGTAIAAGYSGNGAGLNNPMFQDEKDRGPLPQGRYLIGDLEAQHDRLGANVMPLIPDPSNEMFGRGDFWLHGDNSARNGTASEGCIVLPLWARMQIAGSDDRQLEVTA